MRIAYFTESLPPNTDGVSHTLSRLAETLEMRKVDYIFFSPVKPDASIPWRDKVHKVVSIPFPLYKYYHVGLPMFDNLAPVLRQFKPDLVHIASPTLLGTFGLQYARKHHLPAVSSYHTHFVSYFRYYKVSLVEKAGWRYLRWFHNHCAANYAPSMSVIQELEAQGIKNLELWSRGIDLEKFSPSFRDPLLRKSIGVDDTTPVLLFVGRLVKEKDLNDLVQAVELLRQWGNTFKMVFVGDGPMKEALKRRLPEACFTGFLFGNTLSRWFASADIFVFPSTTETFGNVLQESFASGIPAVGVRKGGVVDVIVAGQNGLIAQPNKAQDFAQHIQILLKDENLRTAMGKRAREIVEQNGWDTINTLLLNNYQTVLDRFHGKNRT